MNELTIDGKIYISSKRAAEVTGYAKDYIGQLCREGHVEARMVGRSWYVLESSIRAHRFGGDPHAAPVEAAETAVSEPATATDTWEKPTYVPEMAPSMPIPTISRPAEAPIAETEPATEQEQDFTAAETLTDMQSAWKEWFAQKQDTLIETPEIIDAREEAHEHEEEIAMSIQAFKDAHQDIETAHYEELHHEFAGAAEVPEEQEEAVSIRAIHRAPEPEYEEIEEDSEPVLIHHAPAGVYEAVHEAPQEPVMSRQERKRAQAQARRARRGRRAQGSAAGSMILRALLVVVILVAAIVTAIGTGYAARFAANNVVLQPIFDYLGGTSTYSK